MNCQLCSRQAATGYKRCSICLGLTHKKRGRAIGRNDRCPCNSGKKFKFCCIEPGNMVRLVSKAEAAELQVAAI